MANDVAHKRWWQIFEVIVGIPFLAALALQRVAPLAFPRTMLAPAIVAAGAALIGAGLTLVALARREFARRGQPTDPGRPTSALLTTGVFSFSRNPLYLGGACLLLGVGLAFRQTWALALLLPALAACQAFLIMPEERYLATRFGEEYRAYAATVRRWIGRRPSRRPRA